MKIQLGFRFRFLAICFSVSCFPFCPAQAATFPLKVSPGGHHLVDAKDEPFLFHAETGWTLVTRLTPAETEFYLETRRKQGFTAILIHAVDMLNLKTKAGEAPFLQDRNPNTPNEKYFLHLDWVLKTAREKGLFVLLSPLWMGYQGENWFNVYTVENATNFGRFLGERYRNQDNLMWLLGGDCDPGSKIEAVRAMGNAIKKAAPGHLQGYHAGPGSGSARFFHSDAWNTVSMAYTYGEVNGAVRSDYGLIPAKPTLLVESGYEGMSNDGRGGTPHRMRRQAYGAMLSGAAGHAFGSKVIWDFTSEWKAWLDKPGVLQMIHIKTLLMARKWQNLIPDSGHSLLTSGFEGNGFLAGSALAKDGTFALIYSPWKHTLKVDMGKFKGTVKAQWFDPTNGVYTAAAQGDLPNTGSRDFTMPGNNSAGDEDYLLVLETQPTTSLLSPIGKTASGVHGQAFGETPFRIDFLGRRSNLTPGAGFVPGIPINR